MKEIKETHELTLNESTTADFDTVVVQTDDGINYVFGMTSDGLKFSHRHHPNKRAKDCINHYNLRLPIKVREYIEEKYGGYEMAEGMITQAWKNKESYIKMAQKVK